MLTTETTSPQTSRPNRRPSIYTLLFALLWIVRGFDEFITQTGNSVLQIGYILLFLVLTVGMIVLPGYINAYYDRVLGPENEADTQKSSSGWSGFIILLLVFGVVVGYGQIEHLSDRFSVDIMTALLGCLFAGAGLATGPRWPFVAMGGLMVVVSLLPLSGLISMAAYNDKATLQGAVIAALPGIIILVGGLIDHMLLVRQARAQAMP